MVITRSVMERQSPPLDTFLLRTERSTLFVKRFHPSLIACERQRLSPARPFLGIRHESRGGGALLLSSRSNLIRLNSLVAQMSEAQARKQMIGLNMAARVCHRTRLVTAYNLYSLRTFVW